MNPKTVKYLVREADVLAGDMAQICYVSNDPNEQRRHWDKLLFGLNFTNEQEEFLRDQLKQKVPILF